MRVALLLGPLAPHLAALTTVSLEWESDSSLALSFETLGLCWASALLDQPPPPDHLENHLIWVDSIKVIPLACCRMSFEHLVGTSRLALHWCIKSASVFNKDFYELFSLQKKQNGSRLHIQCYTFKTQANRVVIVSSIITKIFNPMQVLDGHISTFLNDTRVLFSAC